MAQVADRIVRQTIEHVLAVLQEDLPAGQLAATKMGDHVPGLLSQLPFISVSAEATAPRTTGLGRTIALKRDRVDDALIDLGYVTGDAGECRFTLNLWAVTRPQLARLRTAVMNIPWTGRQRSWEAPPGTLHRTTFLRCRLSEAPATLASPLAPVPPHITITANNTNVYDGPSTSATRLGRATRGDQFELLGRNDAATWVQGCCFEGRVAWMQARFVELSVPLSVVPEAEEIDTTPPGGIQTSVEPQPDAAVWRQDLHFQAYLEATEEPTVAAGELIEELQITRRLRDDGQIVDTERVRRFADREEVVDEFPE